MSVRFLPNESTIRCHWHPKTQALSVVSAEVPHRKHVCTVYALLCPSCHAEVNRATKEAV